MSKSTTVIIIYVLGLVIGALFFDLWGAETSIKKGLIGIGCCLLYTSPSPRDSCASRMPSSA